MSARGERGGAARPACPAGQIPLPSFIQAIPMSVRAREHGVSGAGMLECAGEDPGDEGTLPARRRRARWRADPVPGRGQRPGPPSGAAASRHSQAEG